MECIFIFWQKEINVEVVNEDSVSTIGITIGITYCHFICNLIGAYKIFKTSTLRVSQQWFLTSELFSARSHLSLLKKQKLTAFFSGVGFCRSLSHSLFLFCSICFSKLALRYVWLCGAPRRDRFSDLTTEDLWSVSVSWYGRSARFDSHL